MRSSIGGEPLLHLNVFRSHLQLFWAESLPQKRLPSWRCISTASSMHVVACVVSTQRRTKTGTGSYEWDRWGARSLGCCVESFLEGSTSWVVYVDWLFMLSMSISAVMCVWDRLNRDCIMAVQSIRAPDFQFSHGQPHRTPTGFSFFPDFSTFPRMISEYIIYPPWN